MIKLWKCIYIFSIRPDPMEDHIHHAMIDTFYTYWFADKNLVFSLLQKVAVSIFLVYGNDAEILAILMTSMH
jgi:hypothetical protein